MRISDWSSAVCFSALIGHRRALIALRPKDAQRRRQGHVDAEFARAALVRWSDGGGLDFHNGWYISEVGQNVQWRCGQGQALLVARSNRKRTRMNSSN